MSPSAPSPTTWPRCWRRCRPTAAHRRWPCASAWPPAPSPAPPPTTPPSPPGSPAQLRRRPAPPRKSIAGELVQTMRYGENPHQAAAFYALPAARAPGVATARQLQGKELSYNNIADTDAAFELVAEFDPAGRRRRAPSSSTPTPAAWPWATTCRRPIERALQCDPVSAFGGIVALNRRSTRATAARDRQDLHRGGDRARRRRRRHRRVRGRRRTCACCSPAACPTRWPRARPSARWPAASWCRSRDDAPPDRRRPEDRHQARADRRRRCATCCSPSPSPST